MQQKLISDHLNEPVAWHIRFEFTRLRADQTVAAALDQVRANPPKERVIYFYVVNDDDKLLGVVPTRRLLLSPLDQRISDIMVSRVVSIPYTATVLDACEFFTIHRLLAYPVVKEGRIIGVVDVELYTEELEGVEQVERSDELFQLIGVHLTESQQASSLLSFRNRFPWLICNIGGGILAAFLSKMYEEELQKVVALALFIPVVLALAESVGIQSVSLALQSLRGKPPTLRELATKLRREFAVGTFLGLASSLTVAAVGLVWLRDINVAVCLLGGIAAGVASAAVFGVAVPNLLRLLRRDPQVAAGPIALALADMCTLLIYFNLARWLFV